MNTPIYGKLKNGIKYISTNTKCYDTVTVIFMVKTGSRNEVKKIRGITHFIEHLFFKGTKNRKSYLDISNEIYSMGGKMNAFTGYEVTSYYIKIPSKYLENSLDILSDMLFNSLFKEDDIKPEKYVVISENKKNRALPESIIFKTTMSAIFKGTSLQHSIGGVDNDIKRITKSEILNYLRMFYSYSNIVVSITGNLNKYKNMPGLISKYFNKKLTYKSTNLIKFKKQPLITDFKKNFIGPLIKIKNKQFSQAYIEISFPAYKCTDDRSYITDLIGNYLAGNMSSRLFVVLREENGLVYTVSYSQILLEDLSLFQITCGTFNDKKRILKTIDLIFKELFRLKKNGISKKELENIKKYILGDISMEIEDSSEVCETYAHNYLYFNKPITYNNKIKKYKNIKEKDVRNILNDLFLKNKAIVTIMTDKTIKNKEITDLINV